MYSTKFQEMNASWDALNKQVVTMATNLGIGQGVKVGAQLVVDADHPDQLNEAVGVSPPVCRAEDKCNLGN